MSTAGVPDDPQWYGIYQATIAVTQDPLNQGRVRLFIPQVLGTAQSNWAAAMQPGITPAAGTAVLAVFLGGNINLPYYFVGVSTQLIEAVSSGSTVLNSNPFFTGNLSTGWQAAGGTLITVSPNADTNPPFPNAAFLTLSGTGGGYIQESDAVFTAVVGNYYQIQAWVNYPLGGGVNIGAWFPTAGDLVTETAVPAGEWTSISTTVQATDTSGYPMVGPTASNPGDQFYATAITVIGQPNAADIGGIINGYNAFGTVIGGSAFLLYNGIPQSGNLIGSWAPTSGGVDLFGNSYPIGFNAVQGGITGMGITNAQIMESTLSNCSSIAETISNPAITGGLMVETTITFDSGGGSLLAYATTTTSISENAQGAYQWTCPANITSAAVQVWGAGGGGSGSGTLGGQNTGGPSGGAGEYAAEFSYAVTPGKVYNYGVGGGGAGGAGTPGANGGSSFFDTGVFANGGDGSEGSWTGGLGGTGSTNSVHFDGGAGVTPTAGITGGCSGANSGSLVGTGNSGLAATGSSGAASPTAQPPSGLGGAGGNAGSNGSNGSSPGAGGGGAGYTGGTSPYTKTFDASGSRSYYGSDASNGQPNDTRNTNGTIWQGGETATGGQANGTQKNVITFPTSSTIENALASVTVSNVTFSITNEHSWYGSGMSVQIKEWQSPGGAPTSWNGLGAPVILTTTINEGQRKTWSLGKTVAQGFQSGANYGIALGPGPNAMDVNWYGYFNGTPNSSSGPQLTFTGTTGTAPTFGGNGADGQVYITYTTGSTITCAISPTGGTDINGNTVAAGYTGPTQAFSPTASPATPETWQNVALTSISDGNSGHPTSGIARYKMIAEHKMMILQLRLQFTSTSTSSWTLFTLPSAYCPTNDFRGRPGMYATGTGDTARLEVAATGAISLDGPPASTTEVDGTFIIPLD